MNLHIFDKSATWLHRVRTITRATDKHQGLYHIPWPCEPDEKKSSHVFQQISAHFRALIWLPPYSIIGAILLRKRCPLTVWEGWPRSKERAKSFQFLEKAGIFAPASMEKIWDNSTPLTQSGAPFSGIMGCQISLNLLSRRRQMSQVLKPWSCLTFDNRESSKKKVAVPAPKAKRVGGKGDQLRPNILSVHLREASNCASLA